MKDYFERLHPTRRASGDICRRLQLEHARLLLRACTYIDKATNEKNRKVLEEYEDYMRVVGVPIPTGEENHDQHPTR